jgi:Tol biopolymer transport system component
MGFVSQGQFLELDPQLKWQQLDTEHFRIIYHPGLENLAQEAAKVCEESYKYWIEELKYTPDFKTNIILADTADFAIGAANPLGPTIISGTSWARTLNEWINSAVPSGLDDVLYHEYGHVIDLRKVHGIPAFLRQIFGAIIIPNAQKPTWFIEGIPISAELRRTGASRANATRDAMYLRTYMMNDWKGLPTLAQMASNYTRNEWPSTYMLHHDYGAWMVRFIAAKYGVDKIEKVDRILGSDTLTTITLGAFANFDGVLEQALGVSVPKMKEEFKNWLKEEFTSQIESVKAAGVTPSKKLSELPYWSNEPAWSPDGKSIAYYHYDPKRVGGVRLLNLEGGEDRVIKSIPLELPFFRPPFWAATPSWSPDGKQLIYSRMKTYRHRYIYGDIYLYDLKTKHEKRLTKEARAYNPVFTPDGKSIIFGQQQWGEKSPRLARFNIESKEITVLREFNESELLDSIAVSPDGKEIAYTLWKTGGFQDLYTLPIEGGEPKALTQDKFGDYDPSYTSDGNYILFSSNRSGIDNLYAYKNSDGTFHQITNVLTGAFAPDASPDLIQIAYVGYDLSGYVLQQMAFDPASWKPVTVKKETTPTWTGYAKDLYKPQSYNPLTHLMPMLVVPIPNPFAPGLFALGGDPLGMHFYQVGLGLTLGEKFDKRDPYFFVNYTNHQFFPIFDVNLSKEENTMSQEIMMTLPIVNQLTDQMSVFAGYNRKDRSDSNVSKVTHTASAGMNTSFETGIDLFNLTGTLNDRAELSWDEGASPQNYRWVGKETARFTLRLPFEHDQWLRLRYAAGGSNIPDYFKIGSLKGEFPLRGFAKDTLKGTYGFSGTLQYDRTLFSIEQGLIFTPIFLDDLNFGLFVDAGIATEKLDQIDLKTMQLGYGAELQLSLDFALGIPLIFKVGVAQGLGQPKYEFYWDIGLDF